MEAGLLGGLGLRDELFGAELFVGEHHPDAFARRRWWGGRRGTARLSAACGDSRGSEHACAGGHAPECSP
ncbi:hypothetical protein MSAS_36510 [Mycobacterium saskatchewanense]|nr:hypothetical protein MSAS_36510 [Mycobacterium saskatchewanense]